MNNAKRRKKDLSRGMQIKLTLHGARKLGEGIAPATGWKVETWLIHESANPGAGIAQVQLYHCNAGWCAWYGNITRASTRKLVDELATARRKI